MDLNREQSWVPGKKRRQPNNSGASRHGQLRPRSPTLHGLDNNSASSSFMHVAPYSDPYAPRHSLRKQNNKVVGNYKHRHQGTYLNGPNTGGSLNNGEDSSTATDSSSGSNSGEDDSPRRKPDQRALNPRANYFPGASRFAQPGHHPPRGDFSHQQQAYGHFLHPLSHQAPYPYHHYEQYGYPLGMPYGATTPRGFPPPRKGTQPDPSASPVASKAAAAPAQGSKSDSVGVKRKVESVESRTNRQVVRNYKEMGSSFPDSRKLRHQERLRDYPAYVPSSSFAALPRPPPSRSEPFANVSHNGLEETQGHKKHKTKHLERPTDYESWSQDAAAPGGGWHRNVMEPYPRSRHPDFNLQWQYSNHNHWYPPPQYYPPYGTHYHPQDPYTPRPFLGAAYAQNQPKSWKPVEPIAREKRKRPEAVSVNASTDVSTTASKPVSNKRTQSSKYRGVSWHKRDKAYVARVWVNGKSEHLGVFSSEIGAALAVDARLLALQGPNAKNLNFPDTSTQNGVSETVKGASKRKADKSKKAQAPNGKAASKPTEKKSKSMEAKAKTAQKVLTSSEKNLSIVSAPVAFRPNGAAGSSVSKSSGSDKAQSASNSGMYFGSSVGSSTVSGNSSNGSGKGNKHDIGKASSGTASSDNATTNSSGSNSDGSGEKEKWASQKAEESGSHGTSSGYQSGYDADGFSYNSSENGSVQQKTTRSKVHNESPNTTGNGVEKSTAKVA